jgi:conjugal transfer pilin signal peptidase TrbI
MLDKSVEDIAEEYGVVLLVSPSVVAGASCCWSALRWWPARRISPMCLRSDWIVKSKPSNNQQPLMRSVVQLMLPMLLLLIADYLIAPYYRLAYNESDSLPGTLFLVRTGELPSCGPEAGEHVQFQMRDDARWYQGERLLKVAKGCPGDVLRIVERQVYVNDWLAGEALAALNDGTPMDIISAGVIPAGHYYMWASHAASFDSRYAEFSVIPGSQIIGAATRIF